MFDSFRGAVMRARLHGDLYFAALLEEQPILEAFGPARSLWQGWLYTPAVTTWVFLSQCLSPDHSCRDAVSRLSAWQLAQGRRPCSPDTGATRAREMLCPNRRAANWFATRAGSRRPNRRPNGCGMAVACASWMVPRSPCPTRRRIRPSIRKPRRRSPAAGFLSRGSSSSSRWPRARCWRRPSADTKGRRPERTACFCTLHDVLEAGDVGWSTAISAAGSTSHCSRAARRGCVCCAKHQKRATDFRTGQRLGSDDHLRRLGANRDVRSGCRSNSNAALPDELLLRELRGARAATWLPAPKTVVIVNHARRCPGDSGGRDRGSLPFAVLAGGTATEKV